MEIPEGNQLYLVENMEMFRPLLDMQYGSGRFAGFGVRGPPPRTTNIHRAQAPGVLYLNALRLAVFPKTFQTLPTQFRKYLEHPATHIVYPKFFELLSADQIKKHFLPTHETSYCQSWPEFLDMVQRIVCSASIQRVSKAFCTEEPLHHLNVITTKPALPAILYNILGDRIYYRVQEKISQYFLRVEFDRISENIRNNDFLELKQFEFLYELCEVLMEAKISRRNKNDESLRKMERLWEEVKNDINVGKVIGYIFEDFEHPLKKSISTELETLIAKSNDKLTTLRNILEDAEFLKYFATTLYEKLPKKYTADYWDVETKDLPKPRFYLKFMRPKGYQLPHNMEILQSQSFLFNSEIEQGVMMNLRKHGIFSRSRYDKNWLHDDCTRFFQYTPHNHAIFLFQECGEIRIDNSFIVIPEEHIYGYDTCPPLVSPINTLCKPAIYILRDLYNFLNFELNIFRTIKDANIMDLKNYIKKFCFEFQVTKMGHYCISWTDFEEFLETGRQLFADKVDNNVETKTMMVPSSSADFGDLIKNVKKGIFKFYGIAVDCIKQKAKMNKKRMFEMANEAIYRSFVVEFSELCQMIHEQEQCVSWNMCMLQIHSENAGLNFDNEPCTGGKSSQEFLSFEKQCIANRLEIEMENSNINGAENESDSRMLETINNLKL